MGTLHQDLSRLKGWLKVAPLALLVGTGAALAAQAGANDSVDLTKAAKLSPSETVKEARGYKQKMNDTKTRIDRLGDKARKEKDVIKINCLNDKSVQVKGHIAVADQSMSTLESAVKSGDDGTRQHEFIRMTIVFEKVIVLGTEAENCIGEDVSYVGDTRVTVEIDPTIPLDDPSEPLLPLPDVTRPPQATPFI
jgi:hypothetical protein